MEEYSIVEFEDGLQMIPTSWLIKDKNAAYWPQFTSHVRFIKAVQKNILPDDNWPMYNVKRILATSNTYEKGLLKLKKAEFISDINSESDDSEELKKSRKNRAKKTISSSDDTNDDERIQLPAYPKIPHIKKDTREMKMNIFHNKSKQQLTKRIYTLEKKELEKKNINLTETNQATYNLADDCGAILDKDEEIIYDDESPNNHYKTENNNSSSNSDFQRYIIRKLTDIGFKLSSIEEQERLLNNRIDIMLRKLEKCFSCEEILDKQIAEESLMDNFPIDNIEDLEKFEKSLKDNIINRKELIKQLSSIGGNNIKGITFNLLRVLMSDKLASTFSYVGGKKKRIFYDLQLRKIIFNVVRLRFAEATEYCISEPIKSWLRHANERYLKKNKMDDTNV
ncbi:uncharacterized protein LOC105249811 isoform X2 [Camponotus floridanus]|uniref:uncharacterized protein LOC105249811 isoform X2 n=1 Tax=Camponotus floridanus TaxID=104421 RepID=UPI000DC6BE2E|nr:uncharacterized protein LOC105249811 isoform X2 [Camponotus floridanus]